MSIYTNDGDVYLHAISEDILKEHPNGYYGSLVWGRKGMGKTAYCIKSMRQLFMYLSRYPDDTRYVMLEENITVDEAYQVALDHMVFDIPQLLEKCRKGRGGLKDSTKMIPVITWDDAGVGGSSYLFWTDKELANALKGYNDILRRRISGFLINTTYTGGLLSFIRDEIHLGVPQIEITKDSGWERVAIAKVKHENKRYPDTIFNDPFSCKLPKKVYEQYIDMTEEAFDKHEELVDRLIKERLNRYPDKPIPEELQKPVFPEPE